MDFIELGVGLLWLGGVTLITIAIDYRFRFK